MANGMDELGRPRKTAHAGRRRKGLSGVPVDRSDDPKRIAGGAFIGRSRADMIDKFKPQADARKLRQADARAAARKERETKTNPVFKEPPTNEG